MANKVYRVVIGETAWNVDETGIKVIRAMLNSYGTKLDGKVKAEPKKSESKTKDTYDWYQHFQIDGLKITILFKENDYSFNKKAKMIKYRAKDLGAKWSGDYDNGIYTWTFKDENAVNAFKKLADAGFPQKKA